MPEPPTTPPEFPLMQLDQIAGTFAELAEAAAKHRVSFTLRVEPEGFYLNVDDEAPGED